ncbi:hypothetical protein ACKWTF_004070 [Chironomus riparius]
MMEDDEDKEDTKRKSRNLSEKKRRDQFNLLVNELSSMVSTNSRKMDKSTVLKTTIAFLKNHNEISVRSRAHEIQENWKPSFLPNEEFTHLILEALDGFIIVFSSTGKIYYTSESVTSLLGHLPTDLLNMTIYDLVFEEEQQDIYNLLLNPPKTVIDPLQNGINSENQVSFTCHVKRGTIDNNPTASLSYEYVQFNGYFRDNADVDSVIPTRYSGYSGEADTRLIFVGTGRLLTPQLIREMSIVDTKSEFTSRHSLEWKFLFLDHRASPIIGYLPFEVLGTSGYDYYHFDDLDRVVTCHEALMQKGEGTSCYYRFLTKGQQWIWLQTRFYITYHQWNSKPEFVVCTHRVVSYADVMKQMRKGVTTTHKDIDDNDSATEDRKAQSTSMMATSPWSSKSSRASKSFAHTQESPSVKVKRSYQTYKPDSDSTSMSADSPLSHHSMLTQHSSVSQRSRSRLNVQIPKLPNHQPNQQPQTPQQITPHQQIPQFNLPQVHSTNPNPQVPQNITQTPGPMTIHPSPISGPLMPHHHPHHQRPTATTQIIGTPFIDQSQYITAIPVQPVLTAPTSFPTSATVISPILPPPDYVHSNVVLTPAQNQIQDHLQRKHEELQKLIVQQQDELRRVSEQLFMARYGILPSIVNVTLPFVAPLESSSTDNTGENNRYISTSSHMSQQSYHEHHHQGPVIQNQTSTQVHIQSISQNHQTNQQPPQTPQIMHHPSMMHQHQMPTYDMSSQKSSISSHMDQSMESEQTNNDIMQYMQHQNINQSNQPANIHQMPQPQQQQQQQQQIMTNDDFELIPFQMMNTQAQILFSSGSNSANNK